MVCCLARASEPRLIFRLDLVKSGSSSAVQNCRKQFVQRMRRTDRAVVSNILHVYFSVYHFYCHFSPCLWSKFILLYDFVEDLSHHFFRLFVASFDGLGSDSIAVCRLLRSVALQWEFFRLTRVFVFAHRYCFQIHSLHVPVQFLRVLGHRKVFL